jgi:prevent-host-death family protein
MGEMSITVNMHEAKTNLSQLVKRAETGEDILIARNGHPVARLSAITPEKPQIPWDIFKGELRMLDDFDDPVEEMKDYL